MKDIIKKLLFWAVLYAPIFGFCYWIFDYDKQRTFFVSLLIFFVVFVVIGLCTSTDTKDDNDWF